MEPLIIGLPIELPDWFLSRWRWATGNLVSYSTGRRRVFMFFRGIAVRLLLIF
jgi:hypothetical protein